MLKVDCEACQAPYQVDERRVPPTGLKMRCPKCGHSFVVPSPNAPAAAAPPPAAPPRPAPPRPMAAKQTMIGVGRVAAAAPPIADLPVDDPFADLGPEPDAAEEIDLPAIADEADLPAIASRKPAAPAVAPKPYGMAPAPRKPGPPVAPAAAATPTARPNPPSLQDFQIDLSSSESNLPVARPATRPGGHSFDIDLPSPAAELPSARAGRPAHAPAVPRRAEPSADLPSVVADLPSVAAGLPTPAGNLPTAKRNVAPAAFGEIDLPSLGDLPSLAGADQLLPALGGAGLPVLGGAGLPARADAQAHLPSRSGGGTNLPSVSGMGSNLPAVLTDDYQLPTVGNTLPAAVRDDRHLPAVGNTLPALSGRDRQLPAVMSVDEADFGELELPRSEPPPPISAGEELDLPPSARPHVAPGAKPAARAYGEVDLGGAEESADLAMDSLPPRSAAQEEGGPVSLRGGGGGEAAIPTAPSARRERAAPKAASRAPRIVAAVIAVLLIGGALLQLTSYGAFGYLVIGDAIHEGDYRRLADEGSAKMRKAAGTDLYDQTLVALDELASAHQQNPRARSLTAYAALAEYEAELRFGRDSVRAARAKTWLDEVRLAQPSARYLPVASAAQKAVEGDLAGARKDFDTGSKKEVGDQVQQDIALARGEVELQAKDAPAATLAFAKAVELAPNARAHFGLARAYAMSGDIEKARNEIAAALGSSPSDPGALVLRATLAWDHDRNETAAMQDLTDVTDGRAKAHASADDQARANAEKGWIHFSRGRMGEARAAFDVASKLSPSNVSALVGQGEVLYKDGRYTEALAHFDTAVQKDPSNPIAIVSDAKTKIALERLADAKTQLTAARQALPNDVHIAFWLGKAEEALGNKKAAEDSYLAAVGMVDPKADDAIDPYVALSELLASQGRVSEAQAKLEEAQKKLPDSAGMERALGEVAAVQGHYDEAVQHYQAAVAKDPQDLSSRFLLGVTYRRMQKIDLATQQLDQVLAADKDYPGLAMERGQLYEQSGHVDKALVQFSAALAKAPDDLDLQLRVGAAYVQIGRPDDALTPLKAVFDKRPNSAEVNHFLGRAYFMKGGTEQAQAMRFLKRAVELDPNRAEYHLYLAWIANESSPAQLGLAREEIDKALALDRLLGDAYWQRGVLYRTEGAVDDAIKDLKRALELRPTRFEAHAALAECYEDKNLTAAAVTEWSRAIAGDETHPLWRYRFGKLLIDRGQTAAAVPHLLFAAGEAEKMEIRPGWLADAEFALADGLRRTGKRQEAVEHYRRFLDIAPTSSPDRRDAMNALSALGQPYEGN